MKKNVKLIPAIIQDFKTKEVLMLAYMDIISLKKSISDGKTWFWSRSKNRLWNKGETSGNIQEIKEIRYDCDNDSLLIQVKQTGPACHTGKRSCFYRVLEDPGVDIDFEKNSKGSEDEAVLQELYAVIMERILEKKEDSYTYSLHKKGLEEIMKKIGEEAIEVIIASKHQDKKDIIYETGDLIYHLLVLLVEKKIMLEEIFDELRSRRK
ncbi:MAG: bifunctional phosphoribosyl-AMP cyclohydrolase/phosphoribosyl-ATP diphosphatase HisIE [Actinobacteria bacterium]|nr:bifunctional phosphoribosyl-AMP cyclohydrolase/phosphoribosyl-ATP diphosphatase HisIE [Actinomycetota bacterium]